MGLEIVINFLQVEFFAATSEPLGLLACIDQVEKLATDLWQHRGLSTAQGSAAPTSSSVQLAVDCTRAISLLSASCMSVVFREEKDQHSLCFGVHSSLLEFRAVSIQGHQISR